jgi:hypothetical protein
MVVQKRQTEHAIEPPTLKEKNSGRPFKSCDAPTLRLLEVKSGSLSARTGGKLFPEIRYRYFAGRPIAAKACAKRVYQAGPT